MEDETITPIRNALKEKNLCNQHLEREEKDAEEAGKFRRDQSE